MVRQQGVELRVLEGALAAVPIFFAAALNRRFGKVLRQVIEIIPHRVGKFLQQMETAQYLHTLRLGGVVRQGWRRSHSRQVLQRHIGQQQRELLRLGRGQRQPSPFDRRKIFANRVDFGDRGSAGDQGFVESDSVVERDVAIARQLHHRGPAAADEEENKRVFLRVFQQRQRGMGGGKLIFIRQRRAAGKIFYAPVALLRQPRCGTHSAHVRLRRQALQ